MLSSSRRTLSTVTNEYTLSQIEMLAQKHTHTQLTLTNARAAMHTHTHTRERSAHHAWDMKLNFVDASDPLHIFQRVQQTICVNHAKYAVVLHWLLVTERERERDITFTGTALRDMLRSAETRVSAVLPEAQRFIFSASFEAA
jgi:hypothetical protein